MTRLTFLLSVMSLSLVASSCGKKLEDDKAKAAKSQLIGKWNGKMSQKSETNLVSSSAISLEFNDADEYQITDTSKGNKAEGKYTIYPDQSSISLLINKSDFGMFGLTADSQDYKYQIASNDTSLSLWYGNNHMDLTKDGAIDTNPSPDTGTGTNTTDPTMVATGKWQGNDATNDDVWIINVSEKSATLTITHDGVTSTATGPVTFSFSDKKTKLASAEMMVSTMRPYHTLSSLNLNYDFSKALAVLELVPLTTQGASLTPITLIRKP